MASSGAAASGAAASGRRARLATVGADGTCSACGARLEKLPLTAAQRQTLAAALLAAADERGQRGELERFGAWVAGAAAPFAYIVDGANVGYRSQNFEGGRFSFAQVEIARLALRERAGGREPLLVLPARYVGAGGAVPNHTALATGVGIGSRKRRAEANRMEPLSADDVACVARWRAAGALWEVPDAANDDWHWMYATLLGGADARVPGLHEMAADGAAAHAHASEVARVAAQCQLAEGEIVPLTQGQLLPIGAHVIEVLHTPGHSGGSVCLCVRAREGAPPAAAAEPSTSGTTPTALLVGDTIFPGSCGRLDLPDSDTGAMFESLQKLRELPDDLSVYPGHSYGGEKTTIKAEKANGLLRPFTRDQWRQMHG